MRLLHVIAFCAFALARPLFGAEPASPSLPPSALPAPAAELSASDAIILGVVEGVTEFLPISSTGHLIIANRFLRLDSDRPLTDAHGQTLWYRKPSRSHPAGEALTLQLAAKTYTIVIQFGAIAAVVLLYWSRITSIIRGLLGRDPEGKALLGELIIAFIPAAVLGLLLGDWIDEKLFSIGTVVAALAAGAFLMLYAESWRHKRAKAASIGTSPPLHAAGEKHALIEMTPRSAAIIGVWQCLALWPGMSRSMSTIVGGYFAGLDPRRSAEFSFLLGLATLSAATGYKSIKSGAAMIQVFGWSHVLLGAVVAAVTAAICVRFLVHWLTRHGLTVFAYYRLIVALILAVYFRSEFMG